MKMDLSYDLKEALERQKFYQEDIDRLRKRLSSQMPGNNLSDKQLLLFIAACDGNIEEAHQLINLNLEARKKMVQLFENRDPLSPEIQQCLDNQYYSIIPPFEKENCPIIFHRVSNPNPSEYVFENATKLYIMLLDVALYKYGARNGFIIVQDMKNICLGHMIRSSFSTIRCFMQYIQYALPAKLKAIHVVNCTPLFNRILTLIKPLLKKELLDVIHTHPATDDWSKFHERWIPKTHLPSEFGGDLADVKSLHQQFRKELEGMREYFINEDFYR